jgi:tripartite-type tricarboxylate transporter receptor subunit TctC
MRISLPEDTMQLTSALRVALGMLMACGTAAVPAQPYPAKTVRYIVPFPAAASPDIVARMLTERLSRLWGHQIVVDNRSGAGGTVGAAYAAKAPADGYTLFQCNIASSAIAPSLYKRLPYDQTRDFAPITLLGKTPNVLIVHPALPVHGVKEFIAFAKANPGKLSYGTSAAGTSQQLTMELFKLTFKFEAVHVAYKGAPQALADVVGGQIPVTMQSAPGSLGTVRAGRVRPLGVTSLKRIAQLPDVPTISETLLPDFEVSSWYGLCAPSGVPRPILAKVRTDVTAVLQSPEIQQRYRELVLSFSPTSPEAFARFIAEETARWGRVIRDAHIPLQ